jgi:hypothetical protein
MRRGNIMNRKIVIAVFFVAILVMVLAYLILARPSSLTVLFVDPQTVQGMVGRNFTVNISVLNVVDLYGWEFKLKWDASVLGVVSIVEGPILRSRSSTFFNPQVNGSEGHLIADCTLVGNVSGVSGEGTLMTVQFYVKEIGKCNLNIYDTQLLNSSEGLIAHAVHDGHFST